MSSLQISSAADDSESENSEEEYAPPPEQYDYGIENEPQEVGEEEGCGSEQLLLRNTESFRCLAQILVSSSSFLKTKTYLFPPLVDPGIDEAFNYVEPEPVYDDIGCEKYTDLCKQFEIVPISRVLRSLEEDTLNLKYYGLTPKQMKALTETLKKNAHVKNLVLQDNWFDPKVTELLSNMLEENNTIRVLNLRECRIEVEGAEKLNEALVSSQFLTELDLSFNGLGAKGLLMLQEGLADSPALKVLNLSHNDLTDDCAELMGDIMLENKTIQVLDLSWNFFYTGPGNKKLFRGIKENDNLKVLNLAWNGISLRPAVAPLMRYLKKSEKLEELDISHNRLAAGSLKSVRTGVLKNHSLKIVKIGTNCYSPEEALSMASILTAKPTDPLTHLDMENMLFTKKVIPLLNQVKNLGKTLKIGGILSNYVIRGPDITKLFFERCRFILQKPKRKKLKKDFGHFILCLPEDKITREEFDDLLIKKKMKKLDKDLVDGLTELFPARKKKIDCLGMIKSYMGYYPDTCLPPPKPKKAKKGKKGKKGKDAELPADVPPMTDEHGVLLDVPGELTELVPGEINLENAEGITLEVTENVDANLEATATEETMTANAGENMVSDGVQTEAAPNEGNVQETAEQPVLAPEDQSVVE